MLLGHVMKWRRARVTKMVLSSQFGVIDGGRTRNGSRILLPVVHQVPVCFAFVVSVYFITEKQI